MKGIGFRKIKIESLEKSDLIEEISKKNLLLNHTCIGDITLCKFSDVNSQYHATFDAKAPYDSTAGLIQGFGKTRKDAIKNTFAVSRKEAEAYIQSVNYLCFQIFRGKPV
ncbi:hypothetical protein [Microbulbifer epialgicus]|uniref:Uncharacterized protein n=1 Tax=Microbulbifer epialgicus TaxID=393907 RepID=A0ABV4P639_9GAMM